MTEADGLRDSQQFPTGSVAPSLPGTRVRELHAPGLVATGPPWVAWGRALHIPGAALQHLLQVPGGCTAPEVRWGQDYDTGQRIAPTFLWSTAVFAPARLLSCPMAGSSQLSLGTPRQLALPLHLLILTLHRVLMASSPS